MTTNQRIFLVLAFGAFTLGLRATDETQSLIEQIKRCQDFTKTEGKSTEKIFKSMNPGQKVTLEGDLTIYRISVGGKPKYALKANYDESDFALYDNLDDLRKIFTESNFPSIKSQIHVQHDNSPPPKNWI
ncbi:hypothetical protein ACFLY6_00120 [Candidatus Dependentiae bacterium]